MGHPYLLWGSTHLGCHCLISVPTEHTNICCPNPSEEAILTLLCMEKWMALCRALFSLLGCTVYIAQALGPFP